MNIAKLLGCIVVTGATAMAGCATDIGKEPARGSFNETAPLKVRGNTESGKIIIFVHGIFGDSRSTWTNESGTSWQDMILGDQAFGETAVGTVEYDSPLLSRTSGIEEVAIRILRILEDEGIFRNYREIYFVAHSMGGLVTKRILVELNRPTQVNKLRRIKAVLYISTPAQGANAAELGAWVSLNPQLRDMRTADVNSFIQGLENQWQNLIRDRESEIFPRSYCAYETKPTLGVMIVSRVYAATSCDQTPFPVDANHIEITKPVVTVSAIYAWTRARIVEASALAAKNGSGAKTQRGDVALWGGEVQPLPSHPITSASSMTIGKTPPSGKVTDSGLRPIQIAEYFNTQTDKYFYTADTDEARRVEAGGAGAGWVRTGLAFNVYLKQAEGTVPVCRFYVSQQGRHGTHFYTWRLNECEGIKRDPGWIYEGIVFYTVPPTVQQSTLSCPEGFTSIFRLYNNRFATNDSNHRFTADKAVVVAETRKGWLYEGIAMCSPQ